MNGGIDLKCPNASCREGYLVKSFSGSGEFKCACGLIIYMEVRKLPKFLRPTNLLPAPLTKVRA